MLGIPGEQGCVSHCPSDHATAAVLSRCRGPAHSHGPSSLTQHFVATSGHGAPCLGQHSAAQALGCL